MRQMKRIEAVAKAVRRTSKLRRWRLTRWSGMAAAFCTVTVQVIPARIGAELPVRRINWNAGLKPGLTQTLTPEQRRAVDARQRRTQPKPDVRTLSAQEMRALRGKGTYRNKYLQGVSPWQRSFRDVNMCTGNLFKSFTDIQVQTARGAGLAMQRTYDSDDSRIGPFGIGWTHAYDIRNQDESSQPITDETLNLSDRSDFFGGTHKYHRDADGLYTPPAYMFDELNSGYDSFLVNGPIAVLDDTERSMDGTVKHFIAGQSGGSTVNPERLCDYIQDRFGNTTNLAYNSVAMPDGSTKKLLSTVTDPSGRQIAYTWTNIGTQSQPAWRITQATGPLYSVTYSYFTDPNHPESYQNLQSVTLDPTGVNRTTQFTYTSYVGQNGTENGLLASVSDPLGEVVSYNYQLGTATNTVWVSQVTEPAGVDPNTHLARTQTWSMGIATSIVQGTLTTGVLSGSTTTVDNTKLYINIVSDAYLRLLSYHNDYNQTHDFFSTTYDTANNVTQKWAPLFRPAAGPQRVDNYTYGPHGNVLTHTVAGFSGTETTNWYNGSQYFQRQSVTDFNGHTTTFGVGTDSDPNTGNRGSVLWVQDARYSITGKQYSYTYNQYGQKSSETNLDGTVTNYTYGDQWGNLTQVVQDPGTGHLNRTTTMTYDAGGRVLSSTDPNGRTSTFTYNNVGQPLTASFPATASTPAETVTYTYDGNGRMHSVADNRGTTTLAYETGCDRVSSVTDPVTGTVGYTYDTFGDRLSTTLPGGGTWTYTYGGPSLPSDEMLPKDDPNSLAPLLRSITDDQGRKVSYRCNLSGTGPATGGDAIGSGGSMWASGRFNQVRYNETYSGTNLVSFCQTDYIYEVDNTFNYPSNASDTRMFLTEVKNTWNWQDTRGGWHQSVLSQNDYTYDNAGQRLTNQLSNVSGPVRTESYGYDELNRLTSVNYGDGQTQSYTFDPMSNRTQRVDSVNGTDNYTYNAANMLLTRGSNSYTNDQNGNTLTGGGRTNTWDSENRLTQCVYNGNTSVYTYSADGLRHRAAITTGGNTTTTDFVLDTSTFVREMRAGTNYATYLTGPRGPEYRRDDTAGTVRWYCYDGLGCVLGEVDPNGNLTASRTYDVYGSVRTSAGTSTSKHKFCGSLGHPSEDETSLIYMRARYMDPVTGRFMSEDPDQDGGNWFEYAGSSPTNNIDPTGKMTYAQLFLALTAVLATIAGVATGYALMVLFLRWLFPGYQGGNLIAAGLFTLGSSLIFFVIGLFVNPEDWEKGKTDICTFAKRVIQQARKGALGRFGLVNGLCFLVGFIVGMLSAVLEFEMSDYFREG